ncbi:MAG: hypothetical protein IJP71_04345 [Lachnospiraceae bacterium]|nr:hypothetical protein [Lachnospiraceae bacterium]
MSFLELAKNRYSERFFSSKQIEKEKIDMMLGLGCLNEKSKPNPWHFKRNDISEFVKYI